MLGFSDGLVSNSNGGQLLFDPDEDLNLDSTDSEGTSHFKTQALKSKPANNIPRTRSQTKADLASKEGFNTSVAENIPAQKLRLRHGVSVDTIVDNITQTPKLGDLVYAHKGKNVPFWFPGVVRDKAKKVFLELLIFWQILAKKFVQYQTSCNLGYMLRRKKNDTNSKLFSIPKKFSLNLKTPS